MPLGRVAIVDRPFRKCEAMVGSGIDLDLGVGAVVLHRLPYFLDGFHRGVDIGLGAAEIELGPGLSPGGMRAAALGMGDDGGGVAVLAISICWSIMGRFVSLLDFMVSGPAFGRIARKPGHGKATWPGWEQWRA
jgi:hypothetical protein